METQTESDPQLLARLIKHGGRILVVGGEMSNLPPTFRDHPAILIWDDDKQGFQSKEVPSNTKAILYNRWVSHATAARLSDAARKTGAIKFPMLRTREIKTLLSEIVNEERHLPADVAEPTPREIAAVVHQHEQEEARMEEQENAKVTHPGKKGTLIGFVAKNLALNTDWTQKGTISREAERLLALAEKEHISTTIGSVKECVSRVVRSLGKPTSHAGGHPKGVKQKKTRVVKQVAAFRSAADNDDFAELDRLMEDAVAAIKLVQEQLPKVRSETERLRAMRQKMLDMLKA